MSYQRKFIRYPLEPPFGWTDVIDEYVDMHELRARGWTRRMVRMLLGKEDNRGPVDHWMNFAGKMLFLRARVAASEGTPQFRLLFRASVRGHRLSEAGIKDVIHRSELFERLGRPKPPQLGGSSGALR